MDMADGFFLYQRDAPAVHRSADDQKILRAKVVLGLSSGGKSQIQNVNDRANAVGDGLYRFFSRISRAEVTGGYSTDFHCKFPLSHSGLDDITTIIRQKTPPVKNLQFLLLCGR